MEIIIISCVYPPEPVTTAQTSAQLAEAAIGQTHTVKVITNFPNRPAGKIYPGFRRHIYSKSVLSDQYSILRCFSTFSENSSILSRFLENISFGFTSGLALLFSKKPDVVYANTWPLFATGIVRLISSIRRIPLVISVQDIYPESLAVQGHFDTQGLVYRFLILVDRWIARGCEKIIAISESFVTIYTETRNIDPDRIAMIPNWVEENSIVPLPQMLYRKENGIQENAFVLVYGGNIGTAAGVDRLLKSLKGINHHRELVFIIAGAGSQLEACRKTAKEIKNIRVVIHSPWESEDTSKVLSAADVLVLPTAGEQSHVSVPSKMIPYLLSSRPVLVLALPESAVAQMIDQAGCGWVIRAGDNEAVVRKIEELASIPRADLFVMGKRGREYVLENMASEACLGKIINIFSVVGKK